MLVGVNPPETTCNVGDGDGDGDGDGETPVADGTVVGAELAESVGLALGTPLSWVGAAVVVVDDTFFGGAKWGRDEVVVVDVSGFSGESVTHADAEGSNETEASAALATFD